MLFPPKTKILHPREGICSVPSSFSLCDPHAAQAHNLFHAFPSNPVERSPGGFRLHWRTHLQATGPQHEHTAWKNADVERSVGGLLPAQQPLSELDDPMYLKKLHDDLFTH